MEAENAVVMANLKYYILDVTGKLVIFVRFTVQGQHLCLTSVALCCL